MSDNPQGTKTDFDPLAKEVWGKILAENGRDQVPDFQKKFEQRATATNLTDDQRRDLVNETQKDFAKFQKDNPSLPPLFLTKNEKGETSLAQSDTPPAAAPATKDAPSASPQKPYTDSGLVKRGAEHRNDVENAGTPIHP